MAQLLLNWLNNDLMLSRRVVSFSRDFDDGYLLGEIMFKYNQQVNFSEFAVHGNPAAKIHNFGLLEPTMNKIGVHFNPRVVTAIMKGQESVVKNLLYEMKSALERIHRNCRQNTTSALRGTAQDKVINVIKPTREAYDLAKSATFDSAVRHRVENSNEVMMRTATQRFKDKESIYVHNMSTADEDLYEATMNTHLRTKEIDFSRKAHENDFAEAWDSINLDQWKKNQKVARDRRELKRRVIEETTRRYDAKKMSHLISTRDGTYRSIKDFESRLGANILAAGSANTEGATGVHSLVKTTSNIPGDRKLELMYVDQTVLKEGFEMTTKKIKEHHDDSSVRQHMHEQRRRKFVREYDTMQMKMSEKIFHSEVVAQILNFAVVEAAEDKEKQKVIAYKSIISDNRSNRTALMERMANSDSNREMVWQRVEANRELSWAINGGLAAHQTRYESLQNSKHFANNQTSIECVVELLDKILDVVDYSISCRSLGVYYYDMNALPGRGGRQSLEEKVKASTSSSSTTSAISAAVASTTQTNSLTSCGDNGMLPPDLWADVATMFVADEAVCKELYIPVPLTVTSALWPFTISERPECASNKEWLYGKPFHCEDIMKAQSDAVSAPPVSDTIGSGDDAVQEVNERSKVATSEAGQGNSVSYSALLATANTKQFIDALNKADFPEAHLPSAPCETNDESPAESGSAPAPEALDATNIESAAETSEVMVMEEEKPRPDEYFTPSWLFDTHPRFVLGEAIVSIRCAVNPVADDPPQLVKTEHIPMRLALHGTSDLARQKFAAALKEQIPGLCVIEVSRLIHDAYNYQVNITTSDVVEHSGGDAFAEQTLSSSSKEQPADDTNLHVLEDPDPKNEGAVLVEGATGPDEQTELHNVEDNSTGENKPMEIDDDLETAPQIVEDFDAIYDDLSRKVVEHLTNGKDIPDELYVQLVVLAIKQIPNRNNGYLLQDFPTNPSQALLLMEALSGIRYDSHKPQADDAATVYAPCRPKDEEVYDISKCGLDALIYINNGIGIKASYYERSRARIDSTKDERPVVYIHDEPSSIRGLEQVEDQELPSHAAGIDLTVMDDCSKDLICLATRLKIHDELVISEFGLLDFSAKNKAKELCDKFIPPENLLPDYLSPPLEENELDSHDRENEADADNGSLNSSLLSAGSNEKGDPAVENEAEIAIQEDEAETTVIEPSVEVDAAADGGVSSAEDNAADENAASDQDEIHPAASSDPSNVVDVDASDNVVDASDNIVDAASAVAEIQYDEDGNPIEPEHKEEEIDEPVPEPYIYQMPASIYQANVVPKALANALSNMWNKAEEQSQRKSKQFFNFMRNVRFQMTQRRRCAYDCLSAMLVRLDNRQELFDAFRERFNEVEDDMRYDPDCIAELHLQTLELCDNLTQQSEARKVEGEEYVRKIEKDNVVKLLQHRCRCESAAMLQSEWQRFYIALHVIFDFTKAVKGYQLHEKTFNELEETLQIVFPDGSDGGKGKKGKESVSKKGKDAKPTHEPYREPLGGVFLPKQTMESVPSVNGDDDADAKGKKKDKKAGDGPPDPFAEIEAAILPEVDKWRKDMFSASRVLYEDDEPLCKAVEQAVWYEAEKLVRSASNIKMMLTAQVDWLEIANSDLNTLLADMVSKRFYKELAAINYLVEIIEQCIEEASSVTELWLVSPDTIPVDPVAIWHDFYEMLPEAMRLEDSGMKLAAEKELGLESMKQSKSVFTTLSAPQLQALAKNGIGLSKEMLSCLAAIGQDYSPAQLAAIAQAAEGITIDQLSLFVSGDATPEQLVTLMGSVRKAEEAQKSADGAHIYKPEHSTEAASINPTGPQRRHKSSSLSEQVTRKTRVSFGRHSIAVVAPPGTNTGNGDDAFSREQQKYQAMRKKFEDKLQKRRHARENEFKSMGMSPATAKLAAYNELLLEEQHELADFDARHKPKIKSQGSTKSRSSASSSSRHGRRAGVRKVSTNTGMMLQAKQRQLKEKQKERKRKASVKGSKSPKVPSSPSAASGTKGRLDSFDEKEEEETKAPGRFRTSLSFSQS